MKAVIYARFSPRPRKSAERTETIESQVKRCHEYCEFQRYEVVAEYSDREKSGRDRKRDGLEQAIARVKRLGKGGVLIVYSLSRLSRLTADRIGIFEELKRDGAQLASATELIDTSTAFGRMMYNVCAAIDQGYREIGNEQTSEKMRDMASNGRTVTRRDRLTYGWELDPGSEPHPDSGLPTGQRACDEEQATIQRILALHESGLSPTRISQNLMSREILCRGQRWYNTTVRRIIERETE